MSKESNRKQAIRHNAETNTMWANITKKFRENEDAFFYEFVAVGEFCKRNGFHAAGLALVGAMAKLHSDREMDETQDD